MKHVILYPLIMIFVFHLLGGCNSDESYNIDNIINPPIVPSDTLGIVRGYVNSDDGPVEAAFIVLDNNTTFSDENGFFEFTDCIKKSLELSITHPEFSTYSNFINVTDSLNLIINLIRSHYDYFPLKVGNEWQYHWNYSVYSSPYNSSSSSGLIELKIVSKSGEYPIFIFNIKETKYDSTSNTTTNKYFTIQTQDNDSIRFVGDNSLFGSNGFDITLPRYFTTNSPETIYIDGFIDPYTYRVLKRNVGLVLDHASMIRNTFGFYWQAELIDYNLL